jgi:hypothetical protein
MLNNNAQPITYHKSSIYCIWLFICWLVGWLAGWFGVPALHSYNCTIMYDEYWCPIESHLFMTHKTPRFNYKDHHLHHLENFLDLQFQLENCCLGFHWGICKKRSLIEEWKLMLKCTSTPI